MRGWGDVKGLLTPIEIFELTQLPESLAMAISTVGTLNS